MNLPVILGAVTLLSGVWAVLTGSGRNLSFLGEEAFAEWHQRVGRTMKMLGVWGLIIGVGFLMAGVLS